MKTQNDKLKFVMEAAGECWHHTGGYVNPLIGEWTCTKCGAKGVGFNENPSPCDLNVLFELAEKLDIDLSNIKLGRKYSTITSILNKLPVVSYDTPQEALLNALFVAKGGLEDEVG